MKLVLSMGLHARVGAPRRPALRLLDTDTGVVEDLPVPHGVPHPGDAELTGAHRVGDTLWQCTRAEVFELEWPSCRLRRRHTHPLLHDVHHAIPTPEGLAVAATGHDSVVVLGADGALVAHHWLREGVFAEVFGHVEDFRTVPFEATKPHTFHPNHLRWDDGLWVTCLHTHEARHLPSGRRIQLPGPPHDGTALDGELWFTTIDGQVVAVDPATLQRTRTLDPVGDTPGLPGWCRGVAKAGHRLFVGMTALRRSAHRELLRRAIRGRQGTKRPTRVVELDLRDNRIVAEYPVGNHAGGTLYGIHVLDTPSPTHYSAPVLPHTRSPS